MPERCIPVTPEIVRQVRTPGTVLNQMILEYSVELRKRGVPEADQLSADELLSRVTSIQGDGDEEDFLEVEDLDGLKRYLEGFLERWQKACGVVQ